MKTSLVGAVLSLHAQSNKGVNGSESEIISNQKPPLCKPIVDVLIGDVILVSGQSNVGISVMYRYTDTMFILLLFCAS